MIRWAGLAAAASMLGGCGHGYASRMLPAVQVVAAGETAPVGTQDADAADDPAIWRNPANPQASLILGTDKKAGLYVYGLDGSIQDFSPSGALNNVDLREVSLPDGGQIILVGASDRSDLSVPKIALFLLDGEKGKLSPAGNWAAGESMQAEAYGFCMGGPLGAEELARAYVVMKSGEVAESRIVWQEGALVADYQRTMQVASQAEGCVVDDEAHALFVAEEDVGIWRFELKDPQPRAVVMAGMGADGGLVADVEGLAIWRGPSGEKFLVASSQGDNAYAVYHLPAMKLAGRFRIAKGELGAAEETDGIDLAAGDFGPLYPNGLLVAQDGLNQPYAQNFKLVSWQTILEAMDGQ